MGIFETFWLEGTTVWRAIIFTKHKVTRELDFQPTSAGDTMTLMYRSFSGSGGYV